MRITALSTAALLALGTMACGGETGETDGMETDTAAAAGQQQGQQAGQQAAGELPSWYQVDHEAQTVTLGVVAGATDQANYWNFNGMAGGEGHITVPQGYEVTINFVNSDPNTPHSVGIAAQQGNQLPANMANIEPVFEGAITSGAATMADATQTGESESITFTASEAGDYSMACWVPGHAAVGMWVPFTVASDTTASVSGAPQLDFGTNPTP